SGIAAFLAANTLFSSGLLLAGFALILVGLGFKVAAVPFHMWTPDVYQGAPTPVTGFMAAGAKAAGFAALLRVFISGFGAYSVDWRPLILVLAIASLLVGSIGALVPLLAGAMTFLLLGQAGIPLTSGFVAKFNVFAASVDAREYGLTLVGVIATVIATFFYLRLIVLMYMSEPAESPALAADASA